ncbi:MAG: tRNA (adenosine(37)-N6)-dimethylallyltransferase MiaA [Desulfobulbaceae bacterium]|nr:tRNA (adenosine(37)-N6)-dimethylallyltransferase MiaA [Desulfobulbaceae bacterium]
MNLEKEAMVGGSSIDNGIFGSPILFMAGPTAIGKTELSLTVAERFGCEIIGVDSMQIYRYMDIGTAKPSPAELDRVPHHLIDYVLPDEEFSASRFVNDCHKAIHQIRAKGRLPLLVGGTGLYFTSLEHGIFSMPTIDPIIRQSLQLELDTPLGRERLVRELQASDPVSAARIHPNDSYRLLRALEIFRATGKVWSVYIAEHRQEKKEAPGLTLLKIGLNREREELYRRIEHRVESMIQTGLQAEVESLLEKGYKRSLQPMQSLGYRHMLHFLEGKWTWEKMIELLARDTRRYAKRQLTWFRADSSISWFHPTQVAEICSAIDAFLDKS